MNGKIVRLNCTGKKGNYHIVSLPEIITIGNHLATFSPKQWLGRLPPHETQEITADLLVAKSCASGKIKWRAFKVKPVDEQAQNRKPPPGKVSVVLVGE